MEQYNFKSKMKKPDRVKRNDSILRDFKSGVQPKEIAKKNGVSLKTVYNVIHSVDEPIEPTVFDSMRIPVNIWDKLLEERKQTGESIMNLIINKL